MKIEDQIQSLSPKERNKLVLALKNAGHLNVPLSMVAHVESNRPSEEILSQARETLPAHMVPDRIEIWDALPKLPNGKTDRAQLKATVSDRKAPPATAPCESLETLRGIWSEILGIEEIFDDDDFFELGGDSLLSISVVSKARSSGLSLIPSDLFDFPQLKALAARVSDLSDGADSEVTNGTILASQSQQAGRKTFLLNANRRMLDLLNESLQTPRDLKLITLHWDALGSELNKRIESIGEEFLSVIMQEQPQGPYSIGGFSMGAVTAHEVARQLMAMGHEVDDLVLIDPPENPALFLSTLSKNDGFTPALDERITTSKWITWIGVLSVGRFCRMLGVNVPKSLRARYIRANYFWAASKYKIPRIGVEPIVVRRKNGNAGTIWAPTDKSKKIIEFQCSHHDFHRNEDILRKWTASLAEELDM
ncbi:MULTISPECIES: thioesterase domain-containing protein [unclassified Ruegeria]|uniref:thioesterase domain-containing protein n=1 Tax=unclassified Ruegeria TaxID=2625375 RepID=UPI00148793C8|nr:MULTISPECIES: thioesterase domain-containing protein [unclassified Ruegeria]